MSDEEMHLEGAASENRKNPEEKCLEKDQQLKDWENEYNQLYDKYIRMYSDFENFRRRTNKEKIDMIDSANESLMLDILPVIDDLERALVVMNDAADVRSIKEGVALIYNKFKRLLEDKGLKEIECIEEPFDPELHDAITKIPVQKKRLRGRIIDQVQKGYYLNKKVIRHSKVVVGE